ncbi:hypothetical protein E2320_014406, partial [Naja naja]
MERPTRSQVCNVDVPPHPEAPPKEWRGPGRGAASRGDLSPRFLSPLLLAPPSSRPPFLKERPSRPGKPRPEVKSAEGLCTCSEATFFSCPTPESGPLPLSFALEERKRVAARDIAGRKCALHMLGRDLVFLLSCIDLRCWDGLFCTLPVSVSIIDWGRKKKDGRLFELASFFVEDRNSFTMNVGIDKTGEDKMQDSLVNLNKEGENEGRDSQEVKDNEKKITEDYKNEESTSIKDDLQ